MTTSIDSNPIDVQDWENDGTSAGGALVSAGRAVGP